MGRAPPGQHQKIPEALQAGDALETSVPAVHMLWCLLGCDANVFLSVSCTLKRLKGTRFVLSFLLRVSRCQRVRAKHSLCGGGGLGSWGTGHRPAMSPAVSVRLEHLRPEGHTQPLWFPNLTEEQSRPQFRALRWQRLGFLKLFTPGEINTGAKAGVQL